MNVSMKTKLDLNLFKNLNNYDEWLEIIQDQTISDELTSKITRENILNVVINKDFFNSAFMYMNEKYNINISTKRRLAKKLILYASSTEEAINLIKNFSNGEMIYDEETIVNLMIKENNYKKLKEIYSHYKQLQGNEQLNRNAYMIMLLKAETSNDVCNILKDFLDDNYKFDIKIYDILIKKSSCAKDAIKMYDNARQNCCNIDDKFYETLLSKIQGTNEYYTIMHEKFSVKTIKNLGNKLHNKKDIENLYCIFNKYEIEENSFYYGMLIKNISNINLIPFIITYMKERQIKITAEIYIQSLYRLINHKSSFINYEYILNYIKSNLTDTEVESLKTIYKNQEAIQGGYTQLLFKRELLIKKYREKLNTTEDIINQQYIIGTIISLNSERLDNLAVKKHRIQNKIKNLLLEDDNELYGLQIENLKGQINGINEENNIIGKIKKKYIPIKYIIYTNWDINDIPVIENIYFEMMFYKSENILTEKINSFHLTSNISELTSIIKKMDYINNDIRIIIYGKEIDSKDFNDKNENIINFIQQYISQKVYIFNYISIQEKIAQKLLLKKINSFTNL